MGEVANDRGVVEGVSELLWTILLAPFALRGVVTGPITELRALPKELWTGALAELNDIADVTWTRASETR